MAASEKCCAVLNALIWALQGLLGNHFYPHQKVVSKVRAGAKLSKKYDTASTRTPGRWPTRRGGPA